VIKTLRLELNKYSPVPQSLRDETHAERAMSEISVNLASLYHHYYLDSYDLAPPNPDPSQFEHAKFLLPISEFRFQGDGIGASPGVRRNRSNELGQAFCRWFLYEHLNITYFAHVGRLLNRLLQRPFAGFRLERAGPGDTPDYLCAAADSTLSLAEAKGRFSAVSFKNRKFEEWREQFTRIVFKDTSDTPRALKGHIVATRFATEEDSARKRSTLFAEDPVSPGQGEADPESIDQLATAVRAAHFTNIAQKLRQPMLALSLATGVQMPEELRVVGVAWRVLAGPLVGRRFVGGYFAVDGVAASTRNGTGRIIYDRPDPLRLDQPGFTFFGIEENILQQVVRLARGGLWQGPSIQVFEATEPFYSGFSVLRDGTALAPLEFFEPQEQIAL
jgi:hypothetical protein